MSEVHVEVGFDLEVEVVASEEDEREVVRKVVAVTEVLAVSANEPVGLFYV